VCRIVRGPARTAELYASAIWELNSPNATPALHQDCSHFADHLCPVERVRRDETRGGTLSLDRFQGGSSLSSQRNREMGSGSVPWTNKKEIKKVIEKVEK
jgi:hypothetical protein